MKYKKILLIHNKKAGKKNTDKQLNELSNYIQKKHPESTMQIFDSTSIEQMNETIITLSKSKAIDLVITFGGDGTLSSVVNALMTLDFDQRPVIFPLPGGTGNSFLQDFGINNWKKAFKTFSPNGHILSDVLQFKTDNTRGFSINILGLGFITNVTQKSLQLKQSFAGLTYILVVFSSLKNFISYQISTTFAERESFRSEKVKLLSISNNKYTGNKFRIAPQASINDGLADLIILHDINRFTFLRGFLKIFSGKHVKMKGCTYVQSSSINVESSTPFLVMNDGEILDESHMLEVNVFKSQIKLAFEKK